MVPKEPDREYPGILFYEIQYVNSVYFNWNRREEQAADYEETSTVKTVEVFTLSNVEFVIAEIDEGKRR